MGQADTRVDILLALKERIEGGGKIAGNLGALTAAVKQAEGVTSSTFPRIQDQFESLSRKLAGKFSPANLGIDLLKGFGIGGGFALGKTLYDSFIGDAAERAKAAAEEMKRFNDQVAQMSARLDRLAEGKVGDWVESLAPAARIAEKKSQIKALAGEISQAERDRETASAAIREASTPMGVFKTWMRGTPDKWTLRWNGKADREETAAWAKEKLAVQVRANEVIAAATEKQQALTKSLTQDEKALAAEEQKQTENRLQLQLQENAKIDAAAEKRNNALTAAADKYRELADPAEKFKEQLGEIDALARTKDAAGRPYLSTAEAASAAARIKAEMGHDLENAIDASNEALRDFNTTLGKIENNPALTDTEKHRARIKTLQDENVEIAKQIDLLKKFAAEHPGVDPAAVRGQIRGLEDRSVRNATDAGRPIDTLLTQRTRDVRDLLDPESAKHYQSAGDGFAGSMADQAIQLGTVGDQVARAWTATGDAIRSSLGGAFADAVLTGGTATEKINAFALSMETAFVQSGAQMVADWIWSHAIMGSVKKMFVAEDTSLTVTGEVIKSGAVAAGAATNTAVVAGEAATTAAVTGPAAILRSIMELGPIAGPVVMGLSIAGMLALIAGMTGGFEAGGYTGNVDVSRIAGVVHGREYVMDAATTSRLGVGFLDTLRSSPSPVAAMAAGPAAGGNFGMVNSGKTPRTIIVDQRDRDLLGQLLAEPGYDNHVVYMNRRNRAQIGLPS